MKTTSKLFSAGALALLFAGLTSMSLSNQDGKKGKPWAAPDDAKAMKSPVKSDAASLEKGKALFEKHCKSCHGVKGLGDGPKAKELETACGDFTAKAFQVQTDGEIFYKTKAGRDDMPAFSKKITHDNDIWAVVNYLRTLKRHK